MARHMLVRRKMEGHGMVYVAGIHALFQQSS